MSKKGGKKKGKNGDEELEEEIRMNLKLDIETLETNIHLEIMREVNAISDYNDLIKKTKEEQEKIETQKNEQIKLLGIKSDSLASEESSNIVSIKELERHLKKQDIEIEDLEKQIIAKQELYKKEEENRDEAIKNQQMLFEEMTVRFAHILENTANKLQERVKMGS